MDLPQTFGSNLVLASAIVGFVLPVGIAAVNRRNWPSEVKGISAFVLCCLAALLLCVTMGVLTPTDYFRSALITFFTAIGTYGLYWKPSGIAGAVSDATG